MNKLQISTRVGSASLFFILFFFGQTAESSNCPAIFFNHKTDKTTTSEEECKQYCLQRSYGNYHFCEGNCHCDYTSTLTCQDSDKGSDAFLKGNVSLKLRNGTVVAESEDKCFTSEDYDNTGAYPNDCYENGITYGNGKCLIEAVCRYGTLNTEIKICEFGCSEGACKKSGAGDVNMISCLEDVKKYWDEEAAHCYNLYDLQGRCSDSDGSDDIYTKGDVKGFIFQAENAPENRVRIKKTDKCLSDNSVLEFYCENGNIMESERNCPGVCIDGACEEKKNTQRIIEVKRAQNRYLIREPVQWLVKTLDLDNMPISPLDGWSMTYETFMITVTSKELGVLPTQTAIFEGGYWDISFTTPSNAGTYYTRIKLECSDAAKPCARFGTYTEEKDISYLIMDAEGKEPPTCPEQTKLCPDGTYVGRDPDNNCNFYPCRTIDYEDEVVTDDYESVFSDTSNDIYGVAALKLYLNNIIGGYPDGEFKGLNPVNRAEMAKFLVRAATLSYDENNGTTPFEDVKQDEWYACYVRGVYQAGIINGYPDGTFKPANTIIRAEFLKMLAETFDINETKTNPFADVNENDWFYRYAWLASEFNLFNENPAKQLNPAKEMTRYDVALAIYRFMEATSLN